MQETDTIQVEKQNDKLRFLCIKFYSISKNE